MEMPLDGSSFGEAQEVADFDAGPIAVAGEEPEMSVDDIVDLMLTVMSDGLDHPELWTAIPGFLETMPALVPTLQQRLETESVRDNRMAMLILLGMCGAAKGDPALMIAKLEPLAAIYNQSPLAQGALFHLHSLRDPGNPKFDLAGKICPIPFSQVDVLERKSFLCCANWLGTSVGNMSKDSWEDVWNSETAQAIRESIHDGSYRYCNKTACPKIQANTLVPAADLSAQSEFWRALLELATTAVPQGPETVNLAYDATCNLSCPSCRAERFAADEATRARFDAMQERAILPMLKNAKLVFITGSGDPFASKNFRRLMEQLTPEDYPDLRFQIMTNAMLLTPRQWANFPALHRRVKILRISIDAATGPTHELLRRGARWPVMLENIAFAGQLAARGEVEHFDLAFTVQAENYREMADLVDLAKSVGATGVSFGRILNWGTFSHDQYLEKAICLSSHPDHEDFLQRMQDPRLRDPIVNLGDLNAFIDARAAEPRQHQH